MKTKRRRKFPIGGRTRGEMGPVGCYKRYHCVLVEENYGQTPPFMRIQYADACFDEPYTAERKQWVLRTCEQIRQARCRGIANRSHTVAAKCRACGQRLNCKQAL